MPKKNCLLMIPIYSYMIKNLDSLFCTANKSLKRLHNWFVANKLSLNVAKTCYIIVGATETQPQDLDLKLVINGENIERVESCSLNILVLSYILVFLGKNI